MSTIYHGVTDALIIAPGEQITTANSGLTTLTRTYQCAATYEATAESILVPGYAPADYPLLALQTAPVAQRTGSVTTFACTFYGVLSTADYEKPYDITGSIATQASFEWFDYYAAYAQNNPYLSYFNNKATGSFVYAAPMVTRSWVIPIGDKVRPLAPSSDIWSRIPVTVLSETPPSSTVPVGITVKSGQTQPRAADILAVYGYEVKPISISDQPFGTVKLVTMVFQRLWKGNGLRICPVYHDPAVLTDGMLGFTNVPETTDSLLSGLSITASTAAWDAGDSLSVLHGSAPVTITVTPLDALPDYWVQYKATWTTLTGNSTLLSADSTIQGSGNFGFISDFPPGYQFSNLSPYHMPVTSPVTYTVYPPPFSGDILAAAVTEFGHTVASASQSLTTDGLPTSPRNLDARQSFGGGMWEDLQGTTHGGGSQRRNCLVFSVPSSNCGADILSYSIHKGTLGSSSVFSPYTGTLGAALATLPGSPTYPYDTLGVTFISGTGATEGTVPDPSVYLAVNTDRGTLLGNIQPVMNSVWPSL
jgi:hypothetical protein